MITTVEPNKVFRKASCPWGKKSLKILDERDIAYEDHIFSSEDEEQAFKSQQHVDSTPQIFLYGERVGGYDDLVKRFNVPETEQRA